ncbi:YciI family protein [Rhizobium lusitanum]|uniref:YCII-related domain-containing protein n=1 Tax=Rhizobium lusitanum TaxID=293958 RepID=A0A7X0IY32_9HYPH|nr:YciI family protein [Rhizobium lusitanum]MBB6489311.1 hypothetical protein [Rhizobium lusitanum]
MKFALLIYGNEREWAEASDSDREAEYAAHYRLTDGLKSNSALLIAEELQPTIAATTVRMTKGEPVITDGPFAETTEHLGGVYIIEVRDLDEAIAYARELPGTTEIRPIVDHARS